MAQPHRKGHKFGNKNRRRGLEKAQRRHTKQYLNQRYRRGAKG